MITLSKARGGLRTVAVPERPGGLRRAYSWFGALRPMQTVSRHLNWKLDRVLLRLTRGRLSSTLMIRSALLETVGARTGRTRQHVVIYFNDGERVIVVASNAGSPHHPSWFHNLQANVNVRLAGVAMTASVVSDAAEEARLSDMADRVFPAFAVFRREAAASKRVVPIVALTPAP